jgi:uncharacterized membrane protein
VLFAVWSQAEFTVTFEPGVHGTFVAQVTGGLRYGDVTPVAPVVTGEVGWSFNGWSPALSATVTGDATYTAQWLQMPSSDPTPTASATASPTSTPSTSVVPTSPPLVSAGPSVAPIGKSISVEVSKWAVVNLVLSIVGVVLAVLVFVRALLLKKKTDEDEEHKNYDAKTAAVASGDVQGKKRDDDDSEKFTQRRIVWLVATLVLAIVSVVVFLLTEDMSNPKTLVDKWTIINAVLLIAEILSILFVFHNKKTDTDDDSTDKKTANSPHQSSQYPSK